MYRYRPNLRGHVLVLSDSMLKKIDVVGFARLEAIPGAKIQTFINQLRYDNLRVNWRKVGLVIVHLGTNDVGNRHEDYVVGDMQRLVTEILAKNWNIGIVIHGILPRPRDFEETKFVVKHVNEDLQRWIQSEQQVHFAPVYKSFLRKNDFGVYEIRKDQILFDHFDFWDLHLCDDGIRRMNRIVKTIIFRFRIGKIFK